MDIQKKMEDKRDKKECYKWKEVKKQSDTHKYKYENMEEILSSRGRNKWCDLFKQSEHE